MWLDGRDLRGLPLPERNCVLRGFVPPQPSRLVYVDHMAGPGVDLYHAACAMDLDRREVGSGALRHQTAVMDQDQTRRTHSNRAWELFEARAGDVMRVSPHSVALTTE